MSLDSPDIDDAPVCHPEDLLRPLRAGEKPRDAFRVGMEHEKLGLLEDTLEPVPYFGERSISRVLDILVEQEGFEPFYEGDHIIALKRAGTHISLEPAGQLELSGAVLPDNHATCVELTQHRDLTHEVGEALDIVWLGLGHQPFARREDLHWVPKKRYEVMKSYLPTRGGRALDMMLRTGTVQANFDYQDEADLSRRMTAAMRVSPIASALYANSPIVEGKTTGWVSERQRIWTDVDPDRTGFLDFIVRGDFGYRDWVEWALDVPMFFIRREGRYLQDVTGVPFREFMNKGAGGHVATMSDWQDHLTTLFPEVRVKSYLEVRGADCANRDLNCAFPALWKGVLYDEDATAAATALGDFSLETLELARRDVAKDGLEAKIGPHRAVDLARELLRISREGLRREHALNSRGQDETKFLDPLDELVDGGRSPGRILAELWDGEWAHDKRKLVEYTRF